MESVKHYCHWWCLLAPTEQVLFPVLHMTEIICNSAYLEKSAGDGGGRGLGMRGHQIAGLQVTFWLGSCFHSSPGTEIKFRHFAPVAAEKMHDHTALRSALDSPAHKPWEIKLRTNSRPVDFQQEWWCIGKLVLLTSEVTVSPGS